MDGFINLDKSPGLSSHQAVAAVRRLLKCKAGHAGTLDPMATGVLPLCLGKATRLSEYVMGQQKSYLARICFGVETDSYDADGAIVAQQDASHLRLVDIEALLPRLCGEILQKPPVISAIKRDGQPLYKRARRGEDVQVEARRVHIYSLDIVDSCFGSETPYVDMEISCGKGAYIRSLAHDLGEMLGTGAHLGMLRRLSVGPFSANESHTVARIEELLGRGDNSFILPMSMGIAHLPVFTAPVEAVGRLLHGNSWPLQTAQELPLCRVETAKGVLLGLGNIIMDEHGGYTLNMDKVLAEVDSAVNAFKQSYSVVAIGNFDGVHTGHQQLMRRMADYKQRSGGQSAVVTFKPHPLQLIRGETPPLLNTREEKQALILVQDVDKLLELDFTEALMNSSPQSFVEDVLFKSCGARQVVVGYNFRFGAGGAGDAALLKQLGEQYGITVEVLEAVSGPYGVVSSSNIRRHLLAGDMRAVNHMLGYWYELSGEVIYGRQLGRKLGFPTANFLPPQGKALPPCGVYAVRVTWRGQSYPGVANFGYKPTINGGESQPLVEAHLFDVEPPLYGERITVAMGSFLRGEQLFSDIKELAVQIGRDSDKARRYLGDCE